MNNDDIVHLNELIKAHKDRLYIREDQAARFGLNCPPEILIEIRDIKQTIENTERDINTGTVQSLISGKNIVGQIGHSISGLEDRLRKVVLKEETQFHIFGIPIFSFIKVISLTIDVFPIFIGAGIAALLGIVILTGRFQPTPPSRPSIFGDGRDGTMPESGNLDKNNGVGLGTINGSANSTIISVIDQHAISRINLGDYVLIHQTRGRAAGMWELNRAASDFTGSGTFELVNPLAHTYITNDQQDQAQLIRVPQYTACDVTGAVTPLMPWNGAAGGIFAVMCNGTMTVSGIISADAAGFRGGDSGNGYATDQWQGESILSPSDQAIHYYQTPSTNASAQGGGAGDSIGGGGGGGGYSNGVDGDHVGGSIWGLGGIGQGAPDGATMFFGGGGGGGATSINPGTGFSQSGRGGGLIYIFANNLIISGQITAQGQQASGVMYDDGTNRRVTAGSGGGGQIYIRVGTGNLGVNKMTASGAPQLTPPSGGTGRFAGGAGGNGYIHIYYCNTLSGSIGPTGDVRQQDCYDQTKPK